MVKSLEEQQLDEKYPNRPTNHSETLPFHELFLTLFNPLNENKKRPAGPVISRKKQGPHGPSRLSPHEIRHQIIERFISRWRKEVGDDIYPAFRLILPEKDRERAMYGLKEKTIAKLLIKVMKMNKDSEDGHLLLNWKQPGQNTARANSMAGDFAGRCFEVIRKRSMRNNVGDMTISKVNDLLDTLSAAQKEESQLPIFEQFYNNMNADELMWLIRIILRQMKVGATEKTFLHIWHPDAESLYNISSNLRRVFWELHNPSIRLEGDDRGIALMQCFQPQLAQFQMHSLQKMVEKMRPTDEDPVFWIEEKLDGERMQLHMISDNLIPGGKRFGFWSRKAKDYTYLYGNGFLDENGAVTRHIKDAFYEGVENLILDGEMITWDPERDAIVPFGTLKTAAIELSKNMYSQGQRPLYRVFDILFLNDQALTDYTLRDRRRALEASVKTIHRRIEIHPYKEAKSHTEIDPLLREVVQQASEGLVLKNPRSAYHLNERNDDWMKVKPEYMDEYGENLDCIVIGGYYGSGYRGGNLASFLCGLRVDENEVQKGASPMKCVSFCKVGGGFSAADYAEIRHRTDGKWKEWNPKRPPSEYVDLAGDGLQYERPDVWIRPDESVVLSIKAASVSVTDQFKLGFTLRFPRFKQLRIDRDWKSALSVQGFRVLQKNAEGEKAEKQFRIDSSRKKRLRLSRKLPLTIAGGNVMLTTPYGGPQTDILEGLGFYVMTESLVPKEKSKEQLEQLIKTNGGQIYQTHNTVPGIICIGEKRTVKVASLMKHGETDIVRPSWIFACLKQCEVDAGKERLLLPLEPKYMFSTTEKSKSKVMESVDEFGDSFMGDVSAEELREIFTSMPTNTHLGPSITSFKTELQNQIPILQSLPGWLFSNLLFHAAKSPHPTPTPSQDLRLHQARATALFAGAHFTSNLADPLVTHIIVATDRAPAAVREAASRRTPHPRIVRVEWIEASWAAGTVLDEERFAPF